jgi:hypothetical protein
MVPSRLRLVSAQATPILLLGLQVTGVPPRGMFKPETTMSTKLLLALLSPLEPIIILSDSLAMVVHGYMAETALAVVVSGMALPM